jgi:hypothetical protein
MIAAFLAATGTDGALLILSALCVIAVVGIVGGGMLVMGGDWRINPDIPATHSGPVVPPEASAEAL